MRLILDTGVVLSGSLTLVVCEARLRVSAVEELNEIAILTRCASELFGERKRFARFRSWKLLWNRYISSCGREGSGQSMW